MAMNMDAILNVKARVDGGNQIVALNRGLNSVESSAKGVTGAMRGLTGASAGLSGALGALTPLLSVAGLVGLAKGSLEAGDKMYDLAQRTGVSVEALARFRKAAATSGTDIDAVSKALVKLSKGMLDAAAGSKQQMGAFKALGINIKDSSGQMKSADSVMLEIANRFKAMPDGVEKTALALKYFGKSGAEMIPMLNMGGDAIDKLSVKMTTAFAEKADAYSDKLAMLSGKVGALGADLLIALLPALDKITDAVTGAVTAFNNLPDPVKNFAISGAAIAIAWGPVVSLIKGAIGVFALLTTAQASAGAAAAASAPGYIAASGGMSSAAIAGGKLLSVLSRLATIGIITVGVNYVTNVVGAALTLKQLQDRDKRGGAAADFAGATRQQVLAAQEKQRRNLKNLERQDNQRRNNLASNPFSGLMALFGAGPFMAAEQQGIGYKAKYAQGVLGLDPKKFRDTPAGTGGFNPDLGALNTGGGGGKEKKTGADKTESNLKKLELDAARIALQAQYVKDERQINDLKRIGNGFQANGNTLKAFEVAKSEAILQAKMAEKKVTDETLLKLKESADDKDKANRKQRDTNILAEAAVKVAEEEEKLRSKLLDIDQQITEERKKQARDQEKTLGDIRNRTKYAIIGATQGGEAESRQREMDDIKRRIDDAKGRGDNDEARRLQEQLDALIAQFREMDALANNAAFGFAKGIRGYLDGIGSLADSMAGLTRNVLQGLEDKLVEFVTTGKINFRDFANEIIKQLIRIAIQQAILKPLLQGFGSIFGGASGGAGIAGGQSILTAANGMVAANGIIPFAAGGIVNRPTFFKFAQGGTMQNGLMGEAGPEAIMPLKRGRDGKLGVAGGGGGGTTNITIAVDAKGTKAEGDQARSGALARDLAAVVDQRLVYHKRPGGILA